MPAPLRRNRWYEWQLTRDALARNAERRRRCWSTRRRADEPPAGIDPRPDPRAHPEFWRE